MNALIKPCQPIDDLEDELISSWRDVSQATHRFLLLLREFDLRQGWREWGMVDCADWLNLKCGITRNTAQEKLRVAKTLRLLPQVEEAFKRGDLSYSKVRALTRIATDVNETDLLDYAIHASAAQVERYCRQLRNGSTDSVDAARRAHEGRSLSRSFNDDGTGTLSVQLPRADLELVMQALERVACRLPNDDPEIEPSLFARGADALVQMARCALEEETSDGGNAEHYQVVVHVDEQALQGRGGKSDLPIDTVKRLCCDGSIVPIVDDPNGEPLNVGRKQRTVPTAIKRALLARDRCCTFPGCTHDKWVDAHHIEHWAAGGETSLDNLTLLCTHHHRLVHEGGFIIERRADGSRYFARPDRRPVEVGRTETVEEVRETRALYVVAHFPRKVISSGSSAFAFRGKSFG
ncbi:MAG: DUF222 domain-containing protein [Gammaproteobacteria bacterium]|nr:DUF222 domain-containing protein [Gammaproteobacteria bacterium]